LTANTFTVLGVTVGVTFGVTGVAVGVTGVAVAVGVIGVAVGVTGVGVGVGAEPPGSVRQPVIVPLGSVLSETVFSPAPG
jgi:hypothetical protein